MQFLFTIALATIAGYMLIGGLGGTILLMVGAPKAAPIAVSIGWLLGGIFGIGGEVERLRRSRNRKATIESATVDENYGMRFRLPSIGQFFKTFGFGGLLGGVVGVAASILLSVLLISITTSPFVPNSWRPKTHAPVIREHELDSARSHRRDGATTGFNHPLLGPIFIYSTGPLFALGLLGGAGLAFFENENENGA